MIDPKTIVFRKEEVADKENVFIDKINNELPYRKKSQSNFQNLFLKSEEIVKMTQEISDITKSNERRDQVRNKIYAFDSQSSASSVNQNESSQIDSKIKVRLDKGAGSFEKMVENLNKENLSRKNLDLRNIQPFQVSTELNRASKSKPTFKVEIKNEYNEMKENVECLEKLLSYQQNFCDECTQEIEMFNKKIEEKTKIIQETNSRINNISEEMLESTKYFDIEYMKLLEEAELLQKECEELKNNNDIEDTKYRDILRELQEAQKDLNIKMQENQEYEDRIRKEEEEVRWKENYATELKDSLLHYQRLQIDLENDLKEIFEKKKFLNNELQELKGNIRVYCRVRPYLENDPVEEIAHEMLKIRSCTSLDLTVPQNFLKSENNIKEYKFNFEHIFDQNAKQIDIFNELSQLIQSALDGYNVCIFAYGQTGSGKTYTMEGNSSNDEAKGIILRSVELIFDQISYMKNFGWEYRVFVSFQEIYNEQARDLLTSSPDPKIEVKNERELYPLLKTASENRAVAETQCNEHSSRSHSIFQLKLRGRNEQAKQESNGTLNLIDLAGSERLAVSKAEGERLKETQSINKSLTSLGDVITALANKDKHIPYRNSKLTFVLQPYLGGDSKTLMLVNLSPLLSNFHQTLCTLRFAAKVKSCEVGTAKKHTKNL